MKNTLLRSSPLLLSHHGSHAKLVNAETIVAESGRRLQQGKVNLKSLYPGSRRERGQGAFCCRLDLVQVICDGPSASYDLPIPVLVFISNGSLKVQS